MRGRKVVAIDASQYPGNDPVSGEARAGSDNRGMVECGGEIVGTRRVSLLAGTAMSVRGVRNV